MVAVAAAAHGSCERRLADALRGRRRRSAEATSVGEALGRHRPRRATQRSARHVVASSARHRPLVDVACLGRCLDSSCIRRHFAARQLELHADRLDVAQLGQRRQLVEALQAEVVEELARGAEQLRTARHLAMADDANPVALLQRAHDRRADRHAADLFDLAARDRLAIGDQRQRLQQRARIARRTLLPQARHDVGAARTNLDAPAARDLDQLDAARLVLGGEQVERGTQLLGRRPLALVEQLQQLLA